MQRRALLALTVFFLPVAATGCRFMSTFNSRSGAGPASSSPAAIREMPRVTFSDLDAAGKRLAAAGLTVAVKRPALQVNPRAGSGLQPFTLPEIVEPFRPSQWNHMVAEQDPPPGRGLQPGAVVTLTAGVHHGAGPFRRWLDSHAGSVGSRGEQRCRDCHTIAYCADCHDRVFRRAEGPGQGKKD